MNLQEIISSPKMEEIINKYYHRIPNFDILENRNLIKILENDIVSAFGIDTYNYLVSITMDYYSYRLDTKKIKLLQTYSLVKDRSQFSQEDQAAYQNFVSSITFSKDKKTLYSKDFNEQKLLIKLFIDKYYFHDDKQDYSLDDVIAVCMIDLNRIIKSHKYVNYNYESKVFESFRKSLNRELPHKNIVKVNCYDNDEALELEDDTFNKSLLSNENMEIILNAINKLDERTSYIIKSYFGINTEKKKENYLANELGITSGRVYQILSKGLREMKAHINQKNDLFPKHKNNRQEDPTREPLPAKNKYNEYLLDYDKAVKTNLINLFVFVNKVLSQDIAPAIHVIDLNKYAEEIATMTNNNTVINFKDYIINGDLDLNIYQKEYTRLLNALREMPTSNYSPKLINLIINDFCYYNYDLFNKIQDDITVVSHEPENKQVEIENYDNHDLKQNLINLIYDIKDNIDIENDDVLYLYDFDFGTYSSSIQELEKNTSSDLIDAKKYNRLLCKKLIILVGDILAIDENRDITYLSSLYNDLKKYQKSNLKSIQ